MTGPAVAVTVADLVAVSGLASLPLDASADMRLPVLQHLRRALDGADPVAIAAVRDAAAAHGISSGMLDAAIPAPEPPRPLFRPLPPAEAFPVEALGAVLRGAAEAVQDRVQAPMAICAQSVLATATLAVQAHADVELPTGHRRPLSGYFITVAASGERKSAADADAMAPVRKREEALRGAYADAMPKYINAAAAWEAQRRQVCGASKVHQSVDAKRKALDALGDAPERPLEPLLTSDEPTFEGLVLLLRTGLPSVGVFSAEGGQFVGGHGMSADHRLKTAAALSGLWDGEPIRRVRAGDGVSILPGRRVALHLMVQPNVAAELLSDPLLAGQGLFSRFLLVAPTSTAGTRFWRDPAATSDEALRAYADALLRRLRAKLPLVKGTRNELKPRTLPLSKDARLVWTAFADHVEERLAPGGELCAIAGLANKMPEHAARLAAVLALVENIEAKAVTAKQLAAGMQLAEHYATEALRIFEAGLTDPDLRLADALLTWLRDDWKEPGGLVSLPDIYQRGPAAVRDAKTARKLVGILEAHGHLAAVEGGAKVGDVQRREAWVLCRAEA